MLFAASLAVVAAIVMVPLLLVLGRGTARGRRDSALALYRAQLRELERDSAEGRLGEREHAAAKLEIERRLLAEAQETDPPVRQGRVSAALLLLLAIPVVAGGVYLLGGEPQMPPEPYAQVQAQVHREQAQADVLIARLRERLAALDPHSDQAREGYVLLGNAEASRGHDAAAAAAWRTALAVRFDPDLAVEITAALLRSGQKLEPGDVVALRRALAEAPPDAPWRAAAAQALKDAGG
jgi:cytochrome c-type biogenesis protein CcmH